MIAASTGDTLLAILILVIIAGAMYGMDYDLRAKLAEQVDEIGAGGEGDDLDVGSSVTGATATLSAAVGADTTYEHLDRLIDEVHA